MAFATSNSALNIGIETTRGTAATGFTSLPVTTPAVDAMLKFLDDDAFRGSPVKVYDDVPGTWHTEVSFKGYVYPDTFPLLLILALGADVVTGMAAPYTHTINLVNAPSSGSQPPSCTLVFEDGANIFQVTGAQLADLTITGGVDKALEYDVKFIGNPWTVIEDETLDFTAESLVPGWSVFTDVNSSALNYIEEFTLKIDRGTIPIFTQGQQEPFTNFAGPCDVSGTIGAVVKTDADPFTIGDDPWALSYDQLPVTITLTSTTDETDATFDSVEFQMTTVQFMTPKRKVDKIYTTVSADFKAIANTTDAVDAGYANLLAIGTNAVASYPAS
jgi:hypothetical protein